METRHFLISVLERDHVIIKLSVPETLVSPEEVSTSVIIDENGRIYERPSCSKRTADCVHIWALRVISNRYSKNIMLFSIIKTYIPIPFSVSFDRLGSPCAVAMESPFECLGRNRCSKICPVDHVLGREHLPVVHLEVCSIILIVSCEHVELVSMYIRGRIRRIRGRDDRILSIRRCRSQKER